MATLADKRSRARRVVAALRKEYPHAECALVYRNALELLVATILSAQCTDARVNEVTKELFRRYPTAQAYAQAPVEEIEAIIRPTGFFRNKAKSIKGAAALLVSKFGGEVPSSMEELLELPGVARKTANVVLGTWFGKAVGVVVDTHVLRVAARLGLSRQIDPGKMETELMKVVPAEDWIDFSHLLIWHGRRICVARKPRCGECVLRKICPSARLFHVERSAELGRTS